MSPLGPVLIIIVSLTFEAAFLGGTGQAPQAFQINVDTHQDNCGWTDVGCAISNAARPVLGFIAVVLNFIIYVGFLATFPIPGAPWWIKGTLIAGLTTSLIMATVATFVRGARA